MTAVEIYGMVVLAAAFATAITLIVFLIKDSSSWLSIEDEHAKDVLYKNLYSNIIWESKNVAKLHEARDECYRLKCKLENDALKFEHISESLKDVLNNHKCSKAMKDEINALIRQIDGFVNEVQHHEKGGK